MEKGRLSRQYVGLIFGGLFVALYVWGAFMHGNSVNKGMIPADQSRYLEIVKKIHAEPFYLGDRNRMPLYPYFQALFYSSEDSDRVAFERAKSINVILSLVLLYILYRALRRQFSPLRSFSFVFVSAFTLFVIRAAYFQVELTYYVASFLSLWELNRLIGNPTKNQGIKTGLLVAVTYLLKASILLAVQVFLFYSVYLGLCEYVASRKSQKPKLQNISWRARGMSIGIFSLVFLSVLSPYLIQNKIQFGKGFYNVNTTFYIWYDSIHEASRGTAAHGDAYQWPTMDQVEIPSMKRYIATHTVNQIIERVGINLVRLVYISVVTSTAYLYACLLGLVLLYVSVIERSFLRTNLARFARLLIYSAIVFGLYSLAYAWYIPIDAGSRFILALFLPVFFVLYWLMEKSGYLTRPREYLRGYSLFDGLNVVMMILVMIDYATVTNLILRTIQQY